MYVSMFRKKNIKLATSHDMCIYILCKNTIDIPPSIAPFWMFEISPDLPQISVALATLCDCQIRSSTRRSVAGAAEAPAAGAEAADTAAGTPGSCPFRSHFGSFRGSVGAVLRSQVVCSTTWDMMGYSNIRIFMEYGDILRNNIRYLHSS